MRTKLSYTHLMQYTTSLEYPWDNHPEPGSTREIVPGVRWLSMPMPGSLAHINLYLLEDEHGWWVIDTGLSMDSVNQWWQKIFDHELNGQPVIGVICTHFHPDHIGQAAMITQHFKCPLYMTRSEYYQARAFSGGGSNHHASWLSKDFYTRAGMSPQYMDELAEMWASRNADNMVMPEMPAGYERLEDGQTLEIGAYQWQIVIGSGHSPEHACLYCPALKIMISGDQILPIITSNVSVHPSEPNANPLKDWMDSHNELLTTPEDTLVLPAHNLPFYGIRQRLRELISHHEERMLAIEQACIEPKVAKDLLPVLFQRKLDSRQMMMALGEAIAHLHLLMDRQRIQRTLGEDGCYHFSTVHSDFNQHSPTDTHSAPTQQPAIN
ncbi:MAG: MBL fold metallo-hydrolase [Gammaproteobacteria bacterium]|jgi:glyoxylase-like metal-dependent hydrolase (beta-lactamase superfamily II)|nr:MBL fold metallo-hydrolase [Gammaproteobacteria bacterium]MCH1551539.1 MBL fold metallo-hydrolase [Pseudomonadales bacterium]